MRFNITDEEQSIVDLPETFLFFFSHHFDAYTWRCANETSGVGGNFSFISNLIFSRRIINSSLNANALNNNNKIKYSNFFVAVDKCDVQIDKENIRIRNHSTISSIFVIPFDYLSLSYFCNSIQATC